MKRVLVPLAPGFEEIEAVTIIDVLRRAGATVVVAGLQSGHVQGSHGISVAPDSTLDEIAHQDFDLVVLPGGMPGSENLKNDSRLIQLLQRSVENKKNVAAICAAPIVLSAAGLLKERRATSYPSFRDQIDAARYEESHVVVDQEVTTSQGVGTALEFSLSLVATLYGDECAKKLGASMLVDSPS